MKRDNENNLQVPKIPKNNPQFFCEQWKQVKSEKNNSVKIEDREGEELGRGIEIFSPGFLGENLAFPGCLVP